jgi:hypothetical protein
MCESNTAALCKSNGKDTVETLADRDGRGKARERHGNGMGTAGERRGRGTSWERHGMCESNTAALFKPNGKDTI